MVLTYYFEGITAPERLKISFKSRSEIYLFTSKTCFKPVNVSAIFYDSTEERLECEAMTEEEFEKYLIDSYKKVGYKFIKKQNE